MGFGLIVALRQPYPLVVVRLRHALAEQDFTILTETDISGLLHDRLGVSTLPQTALGVCRPSQVYAVLQAEPSFGLLVPNTVVVRAQTDAITVVEAANPRLLVAVTGDPELEGVAADIADRMAAALRSLTNDRGPTRRVLRAARL